MNYKISSLNEKNIHECIGDVWKIEILPSKEYPDPIHWGNFSFPIQKILLDPFAWQAVGKMEGWPTEDDEDRNCYCGACGYYKSCANEWKENMHRMIDALCEGKSIEEFLSSI